MRIENVHGGLAAAVSLSLSFLSPFIPILSHSVFIHSLAGTYHLKPYLESQSNLGPHFTVKGSIPPSVIVR